MRRLQSDYIKDLPTLLNSIPAISQHRLFGWVDHYSLLRWDPTIPSPEPSSLGWYEYWYHLYENSAIPNPEIPWERSLGDLLWGKEWLWGDLIFCGKCLKFKHSVAYDTFLYE
jgi:hypothetical protein